MIITQEHPPWTAPSLADNCIHPEWVRTVDPGLVVTRTPLRISLMGGGSDLRSFWERESGKVLSTTVSLYVDVAIRTSCRGSYKVSTGAAECADSPENLKHHLLRECLRSFPGSGPVELAVFSDAPSTGSGLGASSAVAVGALLALATFQNQALTPKSLAQLATQVEIGRCGRQIGLQDQYAVAHGGLRTYDFHPDGSVHTEPVAVSTSSVAKLESSLLLIDTKLRRDASRALECQHRMIVQEERGRQIVRTMVRMVDQVEQALLSGQIEALGELLDTAWHLKSELGASTPEVDAWYSTARGNGATGGKLLGAGHGGHMLFVVPAARRGDVLHALRPLREVPFRIDPLGTRVLYAHAPAHQG